MINKLSYLFKRILEGIFIIFCIITLNFFLIRFMPGNVVMHIVGEEEYYNLMLSAPEKIEEIETQYGLDKSYLEQYLVYLNKTIQLDFGNSFRIKMPVLNTILFRAKWTLCLSIPTILISGILGGATGLYCGWKKGKWQDKLITRIFLIVNTIPTNCLAIVFLATFAYRFGWFPISGITSGGLSGIDKALDIFRHMQLPLIIMILYRTAYNHMLMRSTVALVKDEPYIDTAISKGMTEHRVVIRHLLKNALCPYVTAICMQFGGILAGSMMVEIVFSWKGMGTLIYDSVNAKDYPMMQGCFLFIGICVVVFNFVADILYTVIDPRLKERMGYET